MTFPFALAAAAIAAFAGPSGDQVARRHFERAEKLYALEKFQDALAEYEAAYDAKPLPGFLFNIGQCYRNLGNYRQAVFSYKKYLSFRPEARNRAEIEDLISDLEKRIAEEDRRAKSRPLRLDAPARPPPREPLLVKPGDPPSTPPPPDTPVYGRWWFWTAIAVVTAGAAVGVYAAASGGEGGIPETALHNIDFPR